MWFTLLFLFVAAIWIFLDKMAHNYQVSQRKNNPRHLSQASNNLETIYSSSSSSSSSVFDRLPDELLIQILDCLDFGSLLTCEQVSRRWARISGSVWRIRFKLAKQRPEFPVWRAAPNQPALPSDLWLPLSENPKTLRQHCMDVVFAQNQGKKLIWVDSGVFFIIATSHSYNRDHPPLPNDEIIRETYTNYLYKTEVTVIRHFPNLSNVVQVRTSKGPIWILADTLHHYGVKYEIIANHEGSVLRSRILGDPYLFTGQISLSDPVFYKLWLNLLLPCILHDLWMKLPFLTVIFGAIIRYVGTLLIGLYTLRSFISLRPILGFSIQHYPKTAIFLRLLFGILWLCRIWMAPRLYLEMCYVSYVELGLGYFFVWYLSVFKRGTSTFRILYTMAIVLLYIPMIQFNEITTSFTTLWEVGHSWWIYVQLRLEALLHLIIITALISFNTPPKIADMKTFFTQRIRPLLTRPILFAVCGATLYTLFFPYRWW